MESNEGQTILLIMTPIISHQTYDKDLSGRAHNIPTEESAHISSCGAYAPGVRARMLRIIRPITPSIRLPLPLAIHNISLIITQHCKSYRSVSLQGNSGSPRCTAGERQGFRSGRPYPSPAAGRSTGWAAAAAAPSPDVGERYAR